MNHYDIKEYIQILEGVIPNTLCDAILSEYVNSGQWDIAKVRGGVVESIRNVQNIFISNPDIIGQNVNRSNLDKQIYSCASTAIKSYNQKFPLASIDQDNGYDLLKYEVGGFYRMHTDSFIHAPRTISCSFSLNDDYEGGNWAFFGGELVVRPKKGSAIMFPSNFMYPHGILPVTKGTRYAIITWFI